MGLESSAVRSGRTETAPYGLSGVVALERILRSSDGGGGGGVARCLTVIALATGAEPQRFFWRSAMGKVRREVVRTE